MYCSNACEDGLISDSAPPSRPRQGMAKYWFIMDVCTADGSGPLPSWTLKVSYTTKINTVLLPVLNLAFRGGPNGLSDCDGHLT